MALIAITRAGGRLAARAAREMPQTVVYVSARWQPEAGRGTRPLGDDVRAAVARLFAAYDGLVVFAAVGVAVRLIAPCLRDKAADPAVVAVDDAGRYAVSVLSGHLGGGNALTERVAAAVGAQAIVTTASEAHGLPAVDLLGARWGWRLDSLVGAKRVSAALVNGEPVGVVQEAGERGWWPIGAANVLQPYDSLDALAASARPGIVITDRSLPSGVAGAAERWAVFRPPTLVLGIGASTGVTAAEVNELVRSALAEAGLDERSVAAAATLDRKLLEPGVAEFAATHGLRLRGYTAAELAAVPVSHPSAVVRAHVGTPSVCEAAALLAAGGPLVLGKRKGARATVAIARRALDEPTG